MNRQFTVGVFISYLLLFQTACLKVESSDLSSIPYQPELINLEEPAYFVKMVLPDNNQLSRAGIALGRKLFYDPILSLDSTQSCASCHIQSLAFTDGKAVSAGIRGQAGRRSAMSLANVGYFYKGLFWDGRSDILEHQALLPVEDSLELDNSWEIVEQRLRRHSEYPILFRKAFGINDKREVDREKAVNAIAQFERTLISNNAKFDQVERGEAQFTEAEQRGFDIFFDANAKLPDSECGHCHVDPLFTNLDFENNGIQEGPDVEKYKDRGRWEVSGNWADNGRFRVPTLRNIAVTAPYMHDGSIKTLEEVIDHYVSGGHFAKNVSPNVRKLKLSDQDKADMIAFLHTLTDSTFLSNPAYGNPFVGEGLE